MNDFIHELLPIVQVENPQSSQECKDMVLKIEGKFCSGLPHQSEEDMDFGAVINITANPLKCAIRPVPHID